MEKIELNLPHVEGNEIIIREGEAAAILEPQQFKITGDIRSVATFARGRRLSDNLQTINLHTTVVKVNKTGLTMTLMTDPNSPIGSEVTGTLLVSDELKAFQINVGARLSQKQVCDILKMNRIFFPDKDEWAAVYAAYMHFNYSAHVEGQSQAKDTRGNQSNAYSKQVQTNLPNTFKLKLPIYKGEQEKSFPVEICLDATDAGCKFWLESVELHEMLQVERDVIFDRELKDLQDLVIIYQ